MDALPFGIDFGGSGIKGAPVDLGRGDFAADRVTVPAVVRHGVVSSAANIDRAWIGTDGCL